MARESLPLADTHVLVGVLHQRHRAGALGAADADPRRVRHSRTRILGHRRLGVVPRAARLARAARWADRAAMNPRLIAVACLIVSLCLAGCGQTGPLYLPDDDAKVVIKPASDPSPE